MTSFICYINNAVIKHPIYLNSHMLTVGKIMDLTPLQLNIFIHHRCAYTTFGFFSLDAYFVRKKYLR